MDKDLKEALAVFAASRREGPPPRLGRRYSADGFLPEEGNTVVCHLDHAHPDHEAVLRARDRLRAFDGGRHLLFTPASSLHMTLFEGVIDTRRTADAWPAGLDRDMPVDAVTRHLLPRLAAFEPLPAFRVRIAGLGPNGLVLEGASQEDARILRDWRDALTAPFGYRHDAHETYRFHMTFAYTLAWIPDEALPEWEAAIEPILEELVAAVPVLPLLPPAFCVFQDMTRFEERLPLMR